jgi:hypothetical protein
MPNPRLKSAQLLLGLLAKRCNQLVAIYNTYLVIRVLTGFMFGSVFYSC